MYFEDSPGLAASGPEQEHRSWLFDALSNANTALLSQTKI